MMPHWTILICQTVNNCIYLLSEGDSFGAVPSFVIYFLGGLLKGFFSERDLNQNFGMSFSFLP